MSKFEVGKYYKLVGRGVDGVCVDEPFECHMVDNDGCWSMDARYHGERISDGEGWFVASTEMLETGQVVPAENTIVPYHMQIQMLEEDLETLRQQVKQLQQEKAGAIVEAVKQARERWVREDVKALNKRDRDAYTKGFYQGAMWSAGYTEEESVVIVAGQHRDKVYPLVDLRSVEEDDV